MTLDSLIEMHDREPIRSSKSIIDSGRPLLADVYALTAAANEVAPPSRQISRDDIFEIIQREVRNRPAAERAVLNYISTVENPNTQTPTRHRDLLPAGHPLSTRPRTRAEVAGYMADDFSIPDDSRPLVASALAAEPESVERKYYLERLNARNLALPVEALLRAADAALAS